MTAPTTAGLDVDVTVADRVSAAFTARPGEVVAVVGPNGAGKTSLVRALAGLVPAAGHARLGGRDLLALPARDRAVGLVFQGQLLFPHLTALGNVAFGPRARGVPRREAEARARAWLERVGLAELADRRPPQLSGGQAQRVALARALVTEPDLLLLDEPMTGLDVRVAMTLRVELSRHLAAYGGIALLVTHDAIDALTLADRVLVLDAGRVAQQGTPQEVAARPRTEHVARLVGLNVVREGDRISSFPPSAVAVSLDEPRGSARHRWRGRVASAAPHGDAVRLLVHTDRADGDATTDLIADVTPAAVVELDLTPGSEVWLSVKATAVDGYDAAPAS